MSRARIPTPAPRPLNADVPVPETVFIELATQRIELAEIRERVDAVAAQVDASAKATAEKLQDLGDSWKREGVKQLGAVLLALIAMLSAQYATTRDRTPDPPQGSTSLASQR